jgi:hypothetical protein
MFRRMLLDHLNRLERSEPLMNVFPGSGLTDPIHLPLEDVKFGQTRAPAYRPGEAGESADAELIVATLNTWNQPAVPNRDAVSLVTAP